LSKKELEIIEKLEADEASEWRVNREALPRNRWELVSLKDGSILGWRGEDGVYSTPESNLPMHRERVSDVERDEFLAKLSEPRANLGKICEEMKLTIGQVRYWVRTNKRFGELYQAVMWGRGHESWQRADELAEDLASGGNSLAEGAAKGKALDYYAKTRDNLLKEEMAPLSKVEHSGERTVVTKVVFGVKDEYDDGDREKLALEVRELQEVGVKLGGE
jgi:hypothetical protein